MLLSILSHTAFSALEVVSQEFMSNYFTDLDVSGWTVSGPLTPSSYIYNCAGDLLFGGYQIFVGDQTSPTSVTKTYTSLIPHYSIRIKAKIYKIDAWKTESLFVMLDGVTVQTYTWTTTFNGADICGNPAPVVDSINTAYNDGFVNLDITVPHSSATATITIVSNLNDQRSEAWGFRQFQLLINSCDYSCLSCAGPSNTDCIACQILVPALVQTPFGGTFSCTCPAATPVNQIPLTCTVTPCIACYALGTSCTLSSIYDTASTCVPCLAKCATCAGATSTCTSCSTGYYSVPVCNPCPTGCSACSSAVLCSACKVTYFFWSPGCQLVCPANSYSRELTRTCMPCIAPCASCTSNTFCLTCTIATNILFNGNCVTTCPPPYFSNGVACVTDCSPNAWGNSATLQCQPCPAGCSICPQGQCVQCSSGYLSTGICVATCPSSTFANGNYCTMCYLSCLSCSGPSETQCLTCQPTYYMNSTVPPGKCVSGCPMNTYFDSLSSSCVSCLAICSTCSINPNICTSCAAKTYFYVNSSTCLKDCGSSRSIDRANMSCWDCTPGLVPYLDRCVSCHFSCSSCIGPNFDDCIECVPFRKLVVSACVCNESSGYQDFTASCKGAGIPIGGFLTALIIIIIILNIIMECLARKRTAIIPFLQFCQLVYFSVYSNLLFPSNSYNSLAAFRLALPWTLLTLQTGKTVPYSLVMANKRGSLIMDAMIPFILLISFLLLILLLNCLGKLKSKSGKISEWMRSKCIQSMPVVVTLLLPDILGSVVLWIQNFTAGTLDNVSIGVMVVLGLIFVGLLCWKVEPFIKPDADLPDSQRQAILIFLSPQFKGDTTLGIFMLLIQVSPPVLLNLLSHYSTTQTLLMAMVSLSAFIGTFAIPFERRVYRWLVAIKFFWVSLSWGGFVCGNLGLEWSGIIIQLSWLMGCLSYLGFTLLILLSNLPLLSKILGRSKSAYMQLIYNQQYD